VGVARVPLGLLTNGPSDPQRLEPRQSGLEHHFTAVVVSGELGATQPRRSRPASEAGLRPDDGRAEKWLFPRNDSANEETSGLRQRQGPGNLRAQPTTTTSEAWSPLGPWVVSNWTF